MGVDLRQDKITLTCRREGALTAFGRNLKVYNVLDIVMEAKHSCANPKGKLPSNFRQTSHKKKEILYKATRSFFLVRLRHYDQVKDPSVIPFNLRLKKLAKDRDWRAALSCLNEIKKKGLKPDEISYATAIDACSKALKSKPAVALFEEMKNVGNSTWSMLVWSKMCNIIRFVFSGIQPNVPIYNAVMNACARDNQWKQSLGYLDDMQANGVVPNIVSYNVCLSALEKSKKAEQIGKIFINNPISLRK